jgi:hypothetical protein
MKTLMMWIERWIEESSKLEFALVTMGGMLCGFTLMAFSLYSWICQG